ncbi:ABC transporter substrate-binding protein [Pajaroellobacter abortibovis]|uniref:Solute-binding protein family 5 domain-containing protein n=1 Tax=Pajaroellobacter abortibovis TaxID=1882918 RepID=A0A1L6MYC4_9BACT|nr:ABC transporter substrate-binding protein [Pajaroellobacter abortibovis]APS00405.1 hypothetical protein BCY86_06720 [Pajaroellobacter abortibovis]
MNPSTATNNHTTWCKRLYFIIKGFFRLIVFASLACSRSASHHSHTDHKAPSSAQPLVFLIGTEPETLDPRFAVDIIGIRISRLIHAGLARLNPIDLEPIPYLAKSWRWINPLTLQIDLREDVFFHSGAHFTAQDVVATFQAFSSGHVGARHARMMEPIASVESEELYRVTVRLKRSHATLLTDLELPILRADEAAGRPQQDKPLDGLGPFYIGRRTSGEVLLLPSQKGALPPAHRAIVFRTIRDENVRAMRFYAGSADIAVNLISPTLLPSLKSNQGLAITAQHAANLTYVVLRVDQAPFADARLRKAFSMAIDRELLAQTLLGGYTQPADTLIPPVLWSYTPPPFSEATHYYPEKAIALLDEMGLHPNSQGVRLKVNYLTSTDRTRVILGRTIAQQLRAVGIQLDVAPLEPGALFARLNAGQFQSACLQMPEITEPNVFRVFLHSTCIPPQGANRGHIQDVTLDDLLDQGANTQDREKRRKIYADMEIWLQHKMYIIPLWHEDHVTVTSLQGRSFAPTPDGRWLRLAEIP